MESQEPSGASDAPKPFPKAPLKKKSLFSKRIPANTQDPEPQEGIDFFSRAKDFFPTQVIEQGRRRQEKQDAEERARSRSTKSSEKESTARESKRRRISQHEDEDEDEAMSGGSREASLGASDSVYPTQGSQKSPLKAYASPKSLIQRHPDKVSKSSTSKHSGKRYVALDDSSGNEANEDNSSVMDITLGKDHKVESKPTNPGVAVTTISDDEEEVVKPEKWAKYVAQAEEAKRQRLEREKLQKSFINQNLEPSTASKGDLDGFDDEFIEAVPKYTNPIVQFFITSRIPGSKEVLVQRKFSHRLKEVRLEWCRRQLIEGQPMTSEDTQRVFLTWNMKRQYDVSNCNDIGLKLDRHGNIQNNGNNPESATQVHLEAWLPDVMKAYQKRLADAENGVETPKAEQPKEKKIKLILKSKDYGDCKVAAGKRTTFERMIEVFVHQNNVPKEKAVTLRLDGEDLSPQGTIEDEDLDDLNILEVIIR